MRLSSTLSNCIWKTSRDRNSTTSPGRLLQLLIVPRVKIYFLSWAETSFGTNFIYCPLSFPCVSLWRESLHSLGSCPLSRFWNTVMRTPSLLQGEEKQWLNVILIRSFINSSTEREESKAACRKVKDRDSNSSQFLFYFWRTWRGTGHKIPRLTCGLSRTAVV